MGLRISLDWLYKLDIVSSEIEEISVNGTLEDRLNPTLQSRQNYRAAIPITPVAIIANNTNAAYLANTNAAYLANTISIETERFLSNTSSPLVDSILLPG